MKKIFIAIFLFMAAGTLSSADTVTEVRAWYNKIKADIKNQSLYEVVLNTNNNKTPNPAVGPEGRHGERRIGRRFPQLGRNPPLHVELRRHCPLR